METAIQHAKRLEIRNEGISILENPANIGLPIPEKLKEILVQLKEGKKYD